ncbi:54S ribosomal protein RTC6, mitochondrial [Homalodisca vitripennis]|uniref:54S ribosomal protein RTC6, mitochondrial n=1 Tax=Homalodisca vitripennis TaxID=197043 RepID=UPI001EEAD9BC|nr:54S ribosomal protein RTC6, mitochondrial [Homalodisca vitripennis]XP_046659334.1 54S ribosomal protein RTC6, mitochondrial [Homalodisca vitripennis]XP_046659335.1 54S ribosomal protein RTC6, mitochondrial [Homalodisca vitripennis]XP_046659336.1 54S ribosomal protein RTC6, mitochondrial [Homalodisca vitripennis]XP_046659337.1 54S ribosomal protein RTC6, mitochondrial [Homalodisca vitripennis]
MNFLANTLKLSLTRSSVYLRPITRSSIFTEDVASRVTKAFLQPVLPCLTLVSGFKVKYTVKRRCKDCYMVVRDGRMYNICPTHPRHKQMSFTPSQKTLNTRYITWASQSKIRPW